MFLASVSKISFSDTHTKTILSRYTCTAVAHYKPLPPKEKLNVIIYPPENPNELDVKLNEE